MKALSVLCQFTLLLLGLSLETYLIPAPAYSDTEVAPVKIQGTFDRFGFGPDGKADSIILQDRSVIQFDPQRLSRSIPLTKGDSIAVLGHPILTTPNRVLDRASIKKGDQVVLDESILLTPQTTPLPRPPAPESAPEPIHGPVLVSNFKALNDSGTLFAVGAKPDGEINRFYLSKGITHGPNGSVIEIPEGAQVNASQVQLGSKISTQGVGITTPKGMFIDAMTLQGPDQTSILSARGENGEAWVTREGKIKQVLSTSQGDIDGLILSDDSVIRFAAIPSDQVQSLTKGTSVRAAGPFTNNQLSTERLLLIQQNQVFDLNPHGRRAPPPQEPGQGALPVAKGECPKNERSKEFLN